MVLHIVSLFIKELKDGVFWSGEVGLDGGIFRNIGCRRGSNHGDV